MNETLTKNSANRQIARAAGTVMFAFILSNVVGLVRQILISRAFGTGDAYDAFVAASRYPDLIFNLIAGGALASSFIPVFTGFLEKEDRASAWKLASAVINLVMIVLTAISILSAIFSVQVIQHILAPDFNPAKQQLAASLLRILLIAPTIFGVSGIVMGALNAHQKFLLPALASTMLWVGYIFGLIFFVPSMGIYGLAWGAVLGAFLHIGIQLPQLLRLPKWNFKFSLGLDNAAVREVLLLMGPRLLGVAVVQINFVVGTIIASGQPIGSVSSLTYAFQIMTMPEVAIAQAIAVAALPTFSAASGARRIGRDAPLARFNVARRSAPFIARHSRLDSVALSGHCIVISTRSVRCAVHRHGGVGIALVHRWLGWTFGGRDSFARLLRPARHAHAGHRRDDCDESQRCIQFRILGIVCKPRLDAARRTRLSPFRFDSIGDERVIYFDAPPTKRFELHEYRARTSASRVCNSSNEFVYSRLVAFRIWIFGVDHRADWNHRRRNHLCHNHVHVTRA